MSENCNATKADGEPCDYPAKYEDGKCGIHTDMSDTGGPGRSSKYAPDTREACIEAATEGKSKAGCARAAGVDKESINRWLEEHDDFRAAFARARAIGESKLINGGLSDPDVDSSMAKFLLASSFDYVKAEKREVTGEDGGAVEVVINESIVED